MSQAMDLGRNSTEIGVGLNPVLNDVVFVIVIVSLTLIIMCIFCTIYRINVDEETIIRFNMGVTNSNRIVAPHNTPND